MKEEERTEEKIEKSRKEVDKNYFCDIFHFMWNVKIFSSLICKLENVTVRKIVEEICL